MIASRASVLVVAAIAGLVVLMHTRAHAQWWRSAPADFEECADTAEKAKTREERTSALAECNAKFAGRRKPGGGYTYYDFMQDRTFDIAGPNPTPEEQRKIDQQYTVYLDRQRRDSIAAAITAKQQEPQQLQPVSLLSETERVPVLSETERVPVPVASPVKSQASANEIRPRIKPSSCRKGSFSCDWPRLSEGLNELKKLFSPPGKAKRS